jgi:signal transduction histidine kinase
MGLVTDLTHIGVQYAKSPSERRSIILCNAVSLILASLALVLFGLYLWWYDWSVITAAIPVIALASLSALVFNHLNLSLISRLWMCLFLPFTTMALSIYSKTIYYYRQEELDYFTFRIIILSCCVLPPIFFSIKEKALLIFSSAAILIVLMLHDPLHSYFEVPYIHGTLKESNYYFTNVIVLFMYTLMTSGVIFMKNVSEKNEIKAQILIEELHQTNKQLQDKNTEIEMQNQEILTKSKNLNLSQLKLTDAYKIIEEQRNLLYKQNKHLSTELIEKNKELTETNNELIKHNNELRQFSYTVSHNLRGPVASLMGLLKLFRQDNLAPAEAEIFTHLETSTLRLDTIIKDLSKIIDIRHDIFQIRQKISLHHEISEILEVLNREIALHNIKIISHLAQCPVLYSVKPMVHSILYNLISNAIKYHSPERPSQIEITAREDQKYYYLEVHDNGLGIDLQRDRDNLFKLYKRFHHHTEGKGLGLYLVKLQAEALGGEIMVKSELDQFTSFTVKLKKPENAERQILYHSTYAEIFFDARLNAIGTLWQTPVTLEQHQSVIKKLLEFIKVYNTPNYIADLIISQYLPDPQTERLFCHAIEEASRNGLKRIAAILVGGHIQHFSKNVEDTLAKNKIVFQYFSHQQQAAEWVQRENEPHSNGIPVV